MKNKKIIFPMALASCVLICGCKNNDNTSTDTEIVTDKSAYFSNVANDKYETYFNIPSGSNFEECDYSTARHIALLATGNSIKANKASWNTYSGMSELSNSYVAETKRSIQRYSDNKMSSNYSLISKVSEDGSTYEVEHDEYNNVTWFDEKNDIYTQIDQQSFQTKVPTYHQLVAKDVEDPATKLNQSYEEICATYINPTEYDEINLDYSNARAITDGKTMYVISIYKRSDSDYGVQYMNNPKYNLINENYESVSSDYYSYLSSLENLSSLESDLNEAIDALKSKMATLKTKQEGVVVAQGEVNEAQEAYNTALTNYIEDPTGEGKKDALDEATTTLNTKIAALDDAQEALATVQEDVNTAQASVDENQTKYVLLTGEILNKYNGITEKYNNACKEYYSVAIPYVNLYTNIVKLTFDEKLGGWIYNYNAYKEQTILLKNEDGKILNTIISPRTRYNIGVADGYDNIERYGDVASSSIYSSPFNFTLKRYSYTNSGPAYIEKLVDEETYNPLFDLESNLEGVYDVSPVVWETSSSLKDKGVYVYQGKIKFNDYYTYGIQLDGITTESSFKVGYEELNEAIALEYNDEIYNNSYDWYYSYDEPKESIEWYKHCRFCFDFDDEYNYIKVAIYIKADGSIYYGDNNEYGFQLIPYNDYSEYDKDSRLVEAEKEAKKEAKAAEDALKRL